MRSSSLFFEGGGLLKRLTPLENMGYAPPVLLASAAAVYTSNVLAALRYLPLDLVRPGSSFSPASLDSFSEAKLTEALQSVAASHMIIAVSLSLSLSLRGLGNFPSIS